MVWLVKGLVLFFGEHAFSSLRAARAGLIGIIGQTPYKSLYSPVVLEEN